MSNRSGNLVQTIALNPLKSLLGLFLGFAFLCILILPSTTAFSTIKFGTNLAWTSIGAVAGTIPPGLESFKSAFDRMGETNASAAGIQGCPVPDPKTGKC